MLYKVTPMLAPPEVPKRAREPGQPRKKRKSAVYDHEGNEVLISLMCLKCKTVKPLAQFGLRKMADGAIRNQPWCRSCRGAAGVKPKPAQAEAQSAPSVTEVAVEAPAPVEAVAVAVPLQPEPTVEPAMALEVDEPMGPLGTPGA